MDKGSICVVMSFPLGCNSIQVRDGSKDVWPAELQGNHPAVHCWRDE